LPKDLLRDGDDDDELDALDEQKELVVKIELFAGQKQLAAKSITFKAGLESIENPSGEYEAK